MRANEREATRLPEAGTSTLAAVLLAMLVVAGGCGRSREEATVASTAAPRPDENANAEEANAEESSSPGPSESSAFADAVSPTEPGDDSSPSLVAAAEQAAEYSRSLGGHALLVMVDGEVVFERYESGWSASRPHPLASGTKSFVGVLAAAAVEDGLIRWDQPASEVIEEWREDPRRAAITVRHLLELSSGLDPADAMLGSAGGGPLGRLSGSDRATRRGVRPRSEQPADKFAASVAVPMVGTPGGQFRYGPSHFMAFGELLERVLEEARAEGRVEDESLEAYLDRRVLAPIGLGGASRGWGRDAARNLNLPGGARLTARDWATFGEFVRRGGRVVDEDGVEVEVIDEAILAECFKPSRARPAYGLTWWLPRADAMEDADDADGTLGERLFDRELMRQASRVPGRGDGEPRRAGGESDPPIRIWMAAGLGKQRLYVLPDHGLVVVRFGENVAGSRRFDDRLILEPLVGALPPRAAIDASMSEQ